MTIAMTTGPVRTDKILLNVTGLHKSFESPSGTIRVLQDIALSLAEREFLSVVGESGSGKSTLLHVLGTLEPADAGQAVLAGQQLFKLGAKEMARIRNRNIGFIYQAHHLIPELDAVENVMLPLLVRGEARLDAMTRSEKLLDRLGLADRRLHRPGRLSGGEAQRVAVARALVGRPRLLLADEPTGNLDEHTAADVFGMMQWLCREEGTSVIMVTHSMRFACQSDRVLRLHEGSLGNFEPESNHDL